MARHSHGSNRLFNPLLLFLILVTGILAHPVELNADSKCMDWLMRALSSEKPGQIGRATLDFNEADWMKISLLRQELSDCDPGIVVYCPVEVQGKITNLRFESQGKEQPIVETVVAKSDIIPGEFRDYLKMAESPDHNFSRRTLAQSLMPLDQTLDAGKTVLFKDINYYGLIPEAMSRNKSGIIGSKSLKDALANRKELIATKFEPEKFTAFLGYPETVEDYNFVFKNSPSAALSEWQQYSREFTGTVKEIGMKTHTSETIKTLGTKEALLAEFEKSEGILFLIAHADGCDVRLPGGLKIELKPEDIEKLDLKKKAPFCVVRVCDGQDNGYANAFLKAGARGVWINRGKIEAGKVNQELRIFLDYLRKGHTLEEAIEKTKSEVPFSRTATGLFTFLFEKSQKGLLSCLK